MRRTSVALAHPLTREVGVYLEDERNEYDTRVYYPMRFMKQWYAQREITHARSWLYQQRRAESVNAQNGLAFNGDGAIVRLCDKTLSVRHVGKSLLFAQHKADVPAVGDWAPKLQQRVRDGADTTDSG